METGAGWIDRRPRGRLRLDGRDAASFLHALLSNDILALRSGDGIYATYLTPQGRLLADPVVYRCDDHFLLSVAPGAAAGLAARLDQVLFAEDVRISDVTDQFDVVSVVGAGAARAVAGTTGTSANDLADLAPRGHVVAGDFRIARTDDTRWPSFDVWMPRGRFDEVVAALGAAGAGELSHDLAEALRIDAGRPAFGIDMTEETIPLEAGLLDRAISQTKGCYVGQEVIVRVLHRGAGRVAKRLVRLALDPAVPDVPPPGAPIATESGDVGRVTSAAWLPPAGRVVALGYVRRETADAALPVRVGGVAAEIVGLAG